MVSRHASPRDVRTLRSALSECHTHDLCRLWSPGLPRGLPNGRDGVSFGHRLPTPSQPVATIAVRSAPLSVTFPLLAQARTGAWLLALAGRLPRPAALLLKAAWCLLISLSVHLLVDMGRWHVWCGEWSSAGRRCQRGVVPGTALVHTVFCCSPRRPAERPRGPSCWRSHGACEGSFPCLVFRPGHLSLR